MPFLELESRMLQMGRLQIESIAVASILVAAASFASAGGAVGCQALPEMHSADAANVDYFLKIEGVDGESTSEKHKGEIEIFSYSWGVSQQGGGSVGGGGGAGVGKATFQDFTLSRTWAGRHLCSLLRRLPASTSRKSS